jgi:peptidoglycan/LPS O-acetylase OafA/YrhL
MRAATIARIKPIRVRDLFLGTISYSLYLWQQLFTVVHF